MSEMMLGTSGHRGGWSSQSSKTRADTERMLGVLGPCQEKGPLTQDYSSKLTDKGPETQRVSVKPSRAEKGNGEGRAEESRGEEKGERKGEMGERERFCILTS